MAIGCLGWGSLVWNPGGLPVKAWGHDGPELPVEFARQSADGRITLVIASGSVAVPVQWSKLEVASLSEAVGALAKREGVPNPSDIGRWPSPVGMSFDQIDVIEAWARSKTLDGVVWTALPPGLPVSTQSSSGISKRTPEGSENRISGSKSLQNCWNRDGASPLNRTSINTASCANLEDRARSPSRPTDLTQSLTHEILILEKSN
jgi:hypothetical protein